MSLTFDDVIRWTPEGGGFTTTLPERWMQGRGAFGGILAAAALREMRALVAPDRTPRSVTTMFLGPVGPEPAVMTVQVLREGRSVSFAEAEIIQAGTVRVRVQAALGADRPSKLSVETPLTEVPSMENAVLFSHIPGVTPQFVENVEMLWVEGSFPFTNTPGGSVVAAFLRFTKPAARGYERLLALADFMPAPVLQQLDSPASASTITWTTHFAGPDTVPEGEWVYFRYETLATSSGYCSAVGRMVDMKGNLLVWQEQLHAVFG